MAAADLELGYAGAKVYAGFREGARFVVLLFRADRPELVAVSTPTSSASSAPARRAASPRGISRGRARRASA